MSLFKRTGGEDFPDRIKCMISGPPKSGKTSFLGTVPNIVIADTEPHANNLQSVAHKNIPYITVNDTDDLQKLLFVLRDPALRQQAAESLGMKEIEAVAIDTLDTLQQIMKAERLKETKQTQFLRDDWGWIKEEMVSTLRAFTALPLHVFFIVHTKTTELGKGDDARTIVLPGLQGSIAEDIAGMVGYSLLAFRKQEIRPDGSPYTKYWLRAEGDETYAFLGNRAAGALPDIIEPTFQSLYDVAVAGHKAIQTPAEIKDVEPPVVDLKVTSEAAVENVAQNVGQEAPTPKTDGAELVNAAALSHIKKVYDALSLTFPEDLVKTKTLDEARTFVRMWQAIQADHAAGKGQGESAQAQMISVIESMGWVDDTVAPVEEKAAVEPDKEGTVEQVMAYVDGDLTRAQEVYDLEQEKKKPRATLVNALVNMGARPAAPVVTIPSDEPEAEVTPDEPAADVPEADAVVADVLGGEVLTEEVDGETAPCEECGKPIDDHDIAVLSKTRFGRWLCVDDYIGETKKPRTAAS